MDYRRHTEHSPGTYDFDRTLALGSSDLFDAYMGIDLCGHQ